MIEPTDEYRQQVIRARNMDPVEKLLAGPRLFDLEYRELRARIRSEMPLASEEVIRRICIRLIRPDRDPIEAAADEAIIVLAKT